MKITNKDLAKVLFTIETTELLGREFLCCAAKDHFNGSPKMYAWLQDFLKGVFKFTEPGTTALIEMVHLSSDPRLKTWLLHSHHYIHGYRMMAIMYLGELEEFEIEY